MKSCDTTVLKGKRGNRSNAPSEGVKKTATPAPQKTYKGKMPKPDIFSPFPMSVQIIPFRGRHYLYIYNVDVATALDKGCRWNIGGISFQITAKKESKNLKRGNIK